MYIYMYIIRRFHRHNIFFILSSYTQSIHIYIYVWDQKMSWIYIFSKGTVQFLYIPVKSSSCVADRVDNRESDIKYSPWTASSSCFRGQESGDECNSTVECLDSLISMILPSRTMNWIFHFFFNFHHRKISLLLLIFDSCVIKISIKFNENRYEKFGGNLVFKELSVKSDEIGQENRSLLPEFFRALSKFSFPRHKTQFAHF